MKTSLELVRDLHGRGVLNKEAATRVLGAREALLKQAIVYQADVFFKSAGILPNLLSRSRDAAAATSKSSGGLRGLLDKFRTGGMTPVGPAAEAAKQTGIGWGDVGANLTKMLALAGITAGATAGLGALGKAKRDKDRKKEIESTYHQMLEEFPRLRELHEDNPKPVDNNFRLLAQYAPSLAANPLIAGSFVQTTLSQGQVDLSTIKTLSEIQRRIDEGGDSGSHFDRGVNLATRAMSPFGGGGGAPRQGG